MSTLRPLRFILHPATPIVVGTLLIGVLVGLLAQYSPVPGSLSSPHAQIPGLSQLDGCVRCHAEGGLAQGCLGCHREIAWQLETGRGFHHYLLEGKEPECGSCHAEHFGADFRIINEVSWGAQTAAAFRHPHLPFTLVGKHEGLACEKCHEEKRTQRIQLEDFPFFARERSFLGIDSDCRGCHQDIHSDGLSGACDACHGQNQFRPPDHFDHAARFPLEGGHERLECKKCHVIPGAGSPAKPLPFPFDAVRGTACRQCHDTPHLARFPEPCEACHPVSQPRWTAAAAAMSAERHAPTGFRLIGAHAKVECRSCHPQELSFRERHPDPAAPGYLRREDTCEGCHPDEHRGQFEGKYGRCTDCHQIGRFQPTTFSRQAHARIYPLDGAHEAVACSSCHKMDPALEARRFVGNARECKACHQDPHGGQFSEQIASGDCKVCHSTRSFSIRPFDHERRTGFPLKGAHARAACNQCHVISTLANGVEARRYPGTPTSCSGCHIDVHRGQFVEQGNNCAACHVSTSEWSQLKFNHNVQSRFPLEGAHARAPCSRCHLKVTHEDGTEFVRYRPMGFQCRDCHEVTTRQIRRVR